MILHCTYEELRALRSAGERVLAAPVGGDGSIAAPPQGVPAVEELLPRLTGDLSISTLAEQRRVRQAVSLLCQDLRVRMDAEIIEFHPAHEDAVSFYFDYAHTRIVLERVERMGTEMKAMVDLMSGGDADADLVDTMTFPD